MANLVINISKKDLKDCKDIIWNLIEIATKYTIQQTDGDPKAISILMDVKKVLWKYLKLDDVE